jgi:hypothetical protein
MGVVMTLDLQGQAFGRLIVVARVRGNGPRGGVGGHAGAAWLCECQCGAAAIVRTGRLRSGKTKSCGCWRRDYARSLARSNRVHGLSHTPGYLSYRAMLERCDNPTNPNYRFYGGRGVGVCQRWRSCGQHPRCPTGFVNFYLDMGPRPPGMSLDRIDPDGQYSPENCRWSTYAEQRHNQRRCRVAA